jgi:uncharacterized protein YecE (DUF72 family)
MPAEIHIGTSGFHYKHWCGPFYPERLPSSRMFGHYMQYFDTVELNTTFYRLPPKNAVAEWAVVTPDDFVFTAKGSRFITHMKKLKDPDLALERFFDHLAPLGRKLAAVVFQLPPFWTCNQERLADFLKVLPPHRRYAFEFRNPTWHTASVYRVLERFNAALCLWDLAGQSSPIQLTANWTYIRLHGPGPGPYQGSYSHATLKEWAQRVNDWSPYLKAIFVYFDNDMKGFAAHNALALRRLVRGPNMELISAAEVQGPTSKRG